MIGRDDRVVISDVCFLNVNRLLVLPHGQVPFSEFGKLVSLGFELDGCGHGSGVFLTRNVRLSRRSCGVGAAAADAGSRRHHDCNYVLELVGVFGFANRDFVT